MKLTRPFIALIAALIVIAVVAGCAGGGVKITDPDKSLKEAQSLIQKASTAKSSVARDKNFDKAVGILASVANGQYKKKPQGAQALYALGQAYQTVGGRRDYRKSHTEYTNLINRFGKGREKLSDLGYLPAEIDQVLDIVKDARVQQKKMADAQDAVNSRHRLLGVLNVYAIMDFLVKMTGSIPAFSYWFAIVIITIIVKLIITPLTKAQFKSMKEMQKISPLVKEIQEKYKGDQTAIGQKTMDLYKEHGINPFASCLPILIQMPILLLLFNMVSIYQFQFAKGHFLWIGSSLQHMYDVAVPFSGATAWVTAGNLAEPDLILVVLYVISMFISTKLSNVDPTQAEQQKMMSIMMPIMFAFIFAGYSSAFLLYWLVFNVLQTIQQYLILHKGNEPVLATGPAAPAPEKPKDTPQRPRRRRRR